MQSIQQLKTYCILIAFIIVCSHLFAQLTYTTLAVQYDDPWSFKKLKLVPIRFKGDGNGDANNAGSGITGNVISFSDAFMQHKISVKENNANGADVSTLIIKNKSKDNILLLNGDMVQGGKQDRAFGKTTIIPPGKHKNYVPVFCVEKGRWDDKAKQFRYAGTADAAVRKQIDETQRQSKIWKQIDNELASKNKKNKTDAYLAAYGDTSQIDTSYLHFFINKMKQSDSAYAGFIAITGNRIINAEIFSSPDLCLAAYISMIKSYVHSLTPTDNIPSKTNAEIKSFADKFLPNETVQKKYLTTNGRLYYYNSSVIHLIAYE